jgi:hypothetical protein
VQSDICLHYLLSRMDHWQSFNGTKSQKSLDIITAHCNLGMPMACDGHWQLADWRGVGRTTFPCIVEVMINGLGRSFHTQILKTLVHPVITVLL